MSIRRRIKAVEQRDRKEVLNETVIPFEQAYQMLLPKLKQYHMFFGAGVSSSAGVPLSEDIVNSVIVKVFEKSNPAKRGQVTAEDLREWVSRQKWFNPNYRYVSALEKEYPSVYLRTELFKELLKGKQPSPTHLIYVIGVKSGHFAPILYTTNWDTLAEDAYYILRGTNCITIRSIDALKMVNLEEGRYVIKLHGDYDRYDVRYIREGMAKHHDDVKAFLRKSLAGKGLLVMGYSGTEYSVMNTLIELANDYEDVLSEGLLWAYKGNIKQIPESITDLMAVGLEKGKDFRIFEIEESDYFFEQLAADLELPSIEDELSMSFQRFNIVPYGDIRRREGATTPQLADLVHRDLLDEGFLVASYDAILEEWEKETRGLFKKKEDRERAAAEAERKLINHTFNDLKRGAYEDAERKFKDILERFPQNYQAHFGLTWCYYQIGRFADALSFADKALALNNKDASLHYVVALVHRQQEKWQEEADACDRALAVAEGNDELWYNRGLAYYHLGNAEEELRSYEKALECSGTNSRAWYNMGMVLYEMGRKLQAQRCFINAREIDNRLFKAWYNNGILLGKLGQDYRAMEYFDKAIELNEEDDFAFKNRGVAEVMTRSYARARETYEYFLEVLPDDMESWNNYAVALHGLNLNEEALSYLERYLEKLPEDARVWYNKGSVLWAMDQRKEALKCFDESIRINPNFDMVWYRKALLLGELEDYSGKVDWLMRYLNENPEDAKAWYQLGLAHDMLQDWDKSVVAYDNALRSEPSNVDMLLRKAIALNELRRFADANETIERILYITTQQAESWFQKGIAEEGMGEFLKAINSYEQCIKLDDKHKQAYLNKGVLLAQLEQFAKAVDHFDAAIKIDPDYVVAYENKALALNALKEWDRARAVYEDAIPRFPHDARLVLGLAYIHLQELDEQKSLELVEKAIKIDPKMRDLVARAAEFERLRKHPRFQQLLQSAQQQ